MAIYIVGIMKDQNEKVYRLCETKHTKGPGFATKEYTEKQLYSALTNKTIKVQNATIDPNNKTIKGTQGDLNRLINNPYMILVISATKYPDNSFKYKAIDFNGFYKELTSQEALQFAEQKRILNAMVNQGNTENTIKGNDWQIPIEDLTTKKTDNASVYISLGTKIPLQFLFFTKKNSMLYNKLLPRPKAKMIAYTEKLEGFLQFDSAGNSLFNQNLSNFKPFLKDKNLYSAGLRVEIEIPNSINIITQLITTLKQSGFAPENIELKAEGVIPTDSYPTVEKHIINCTNLNDILDYKIKNINNTTFRNDFKDYSTYIYKKSEGLRFRNRNTPDNIMLVYFGYTLFYTILNKELQKLAEQQGINKRFIDVDKRKFQYYRGASEGLEGSILNSVSSDFSNEFKTQIENSNIPTVNSISPNPILPCFLFQTLECKEYDKNTITIHY